jgi:hypothetical protein
MILSKENNLEEREKGPLESYTNSFNIKKNNRWIGRDFRRHKGMIKRLKETIKRHQRMVNIIINDKCHKGMMKKLIE